MTTEYSIQKMVSDGTLSTITLGIQYLQRNDIYMRIAGEETPQSGAPSGYTWYFIDNTTLKILPVVPNGVEVVVYRRTDVDAMYNIYSQNAQFDEATIDENNQQLLYIAQEYLEQGIPGAGVDIIEFIRDDGSFTYYRIKRTDGSYSDEFAVPSASSSTKILTREALRRSYAEAGYNLVDGSFEAGGTVNAVADALLYEATGVVYSWAGALPKTILANSTPASTGGVSASGWLPLRDITLRAELASSAPGKGVNLVYGAAKQTQVDILQIRSDSFAYIEDYASLVVSGDWTAAIQAAFDTGKPVIGLKGKTYKTTAIINSMGQPFVGSLKLQLARSSIPAVTFELEYSAPSDDSFRAIYVGTAYDLCEMMQIKSLGFNTVIHYCYFDNNGSVDIAGTIPKLIKNCASAGLNVVINTNINASHGQGTPAQIVAAADAFNNVIGYSVIDEPASRNFTVTQQDALVANLRTLTDKKLYAVDFIWGLSPWSGQYFSQNYDVFLVDSYSMYYASGTLQQRIDKDLGKMRTDLGGCMKMVGNAKIIPVVQTFSEFTSTPTEGVHGDYCFDVDQIIGAAKIFGMTGNGNYAAFCWDNGFATHMRNEPKYQRLAKQLANKSGKGAIYRTEPIMFGGVGPVYQRSLHDVLAITASKDPENTSDSWLGGGAYPVRLTTGASETLIKTTTANINISGIGFRAAFSRLVTRKSLLKYFTGFAVFENYGTPLAQPASFNVYSTPDGGYTETIRYSTNVTAGSLFRFSTLMTGNFDGIGEDAVFDVTVSAGDSDPNYRRFVYGLFVSTNW